MPADPSHGALPETGRPAPDLLAELARLRDADLPVRGGQVTAYVYDTGRDAVHDLAATAYQEMLEVNCLDPTAFPSIVALERRIVGFAADKLGGGSGIFTSGGTESIMLAVKAARDARPVEGRPQIVLPATAHPRLPQGRALPRHGDRARPGRRRLPRRPRRDGRRADPPHGAGRRLGAVLSARRHGPGPGDRRARRRARACPATSTRASAAGCCPGCGTPDATSRRSICPCQG
ncbi:hypothetical protein [Actinomadura madurae]|uniref:hypothetical protein n=1 Tax=Actinomadura madurae TaxID=1993 RepID=UPI003FD804B0